MAGYYATNYPTGGTRYVYSGKSPGEVLQQGGGLTPGQVWMGAGQSTEPDADWQEQVRQRAQALMSGQMSPSAEDLYQTQAPGIRSHAELQSRAAVSDFARAGLSRSGRVQRTNSAIGKDMAGQLSQARLGAQSEADTQARQQWGEGADLMFRLGDFQQGEKGVEYQKGYNQDARNTARDRMQNRKDLGPLAYFTG